MTGGVVHWVTEESRVGLDGVRRRSFSIMSLPAGELPQSSEEGMELRPASAPFDEIGEAWDLVRALEVAMDVMDG